MWLYSEYTKLPTSICSHTRFLSTLRNWMRYHPVSMECLEQCLLNMISQLSLGHQKVFCRSEIPKPFHEQIFRACMSTKMVFLLHFSNPQNKVQRHKGSEQSPENTIPTSVLLLSPAKRRHDDSYKLTHDHECNISSFVRAIQIWGYKYEHTIVSFTFDLSYLEKGKQFLVLLC